MKEAPVCTADPPASTLYQSIVPLVADADKLRVPVAHLAAGVTEEIPVIVTVAAVDVMPGQPLPLDTLNLYEVLPVPATGGI